LANDARVASTNMLLEQKKQKQKQKQKQKKREFVIAPLTRVDDKRRKSQQIVNK
jgi:hypothetical protein